MANLEQVLKRCHQPDGLPAQEDGLKRIAIVGGESTGKSTLAQSLSNKLGCLWVPEYARYYLEIHGPAYTQPMVEEMARGQQTLELAIAAQAKQRGDQFLVLDTTLVVFHIWHQHSYGWVPDWIQEYISKQSLSLCLVTAPDLPWQPDPLREHPDLREYFFAQYQKVLNSYRIGYEVFGGARW